MVLKIWSLVIVSLLVMLFSGIVSSIDFPGGLVKNFDFSKVSKAVTDNFAFKVYKPDQPNLFVGGIFQKSSNGDLAEQKWKDFADQNDATFVPTYYTKIADIAAVNEAAKSKKTDVNGLTRDELNDEKYGTIIGYSGGTTTVVTAMAEQNIKADTLILISPMMGVVDNGNSKDMFEQKIQTILELNPGIKIIAIQSPDDKSTLGIGQIGQYNFVGSPFADKVQIVSKDGLSHAAIFDTYAMQNIKDGMYVDPQSQSVATTDDSINQNREDIREAMERAKAVLARQYNVQPEAVPETSNQATKSPVTLTLYVRDGSASGPIIPGAQVTGRDASGNNFQQTTDSNGYVTIEGDSGTWSFSASANGYEINNWDQEITETGTKHAFLQKEKQPSESRVVGKWDLQGETEDDSTILGETFHDQSRFRSIIEFHSDGTFTESVLESYYLNDGVWKEVEFSTAVVMGEWIQYGETIRLQYSPWSDTAAGDYETWQSEGDSYEGTINGDTMSGTGSGLTHISDGSLSYDHFSSNHWTASRISTGESGNQAVYI
jgi:hypothetical protein